MGTRLSLAVRMRSSSALFYVCWVIANMAAVLLSFGLIYAMIELTKELHLDVNEDQLAGALIFFLLSMLLGAGQWLVLRTRLSHAAWWVVATVAGILAGIYLGQSLIQASITYAGLAWNWDWGILLFNSFIGAVMGLAQWLVLRRHVAHAALWVPITVAGWLALGAVIGKSIDTSTDLVMFGLMPAVITGAGLLWLLRHSLAD